MTMSVVSSGRTRARIGGACSAGLGRPRRHGAPRLAALLLAAALGLAGCAILDKPVRPAVYDFGPGALSGAAMAAFASATVVVLPEVETGSALDSTALLYRLAYADAQQLLPYAQARWSMAPAQLLRQRLRDALGQRGTVLTPGEGQVAAAAAPLVLRIELEEFSQIFDTPARSVGLVRLRATAVRGTAAGDRLLGQRSFVAQRPAPSADAPGGVRALTAATDAAVQDILAWLSQLP